MSATGDKIMGKVKEITGSITGDRKQEAKGKAQQVKGGVEDKLQGDDEPDQDPGAGQAP